MADGIMRRSKGLTNRYKLTLCRYRERVFLFVIASLACVSLSAHPMPSSLVNLSVLDTFIKGEARIPFLELENAVSQQAHGNINSALLHDYFARHIMAVNGYEAWRTEVDKLELTTDTAPIIGNYQEVVVHFRMIPRDPGSLRHFTFHYDAILHQVVTHRALIFVQYDWHNGIYDGAASQPIGVIGMDVPSGKIPPLEIDLGNGSLWNGFVGMFKHGMHHIREGLDHILFLLTLLLIAPLTPFGKQWSQYQGLRYTLTRFLGISLAFTLGHSITLLAGTSGVLPFQVQYIEIVIAVSIVVCAAHCIAPLFFQRETLLAGGFGLIHGMAFSTSLSSMDLSTGSKLISLLGFNLGIEAMQLVIMACCFPILLSSRWRFYTVLRTAFAVVTMLVSIAWVIERVAGQENFITAYVNTLL